MQKDKETGIELFVRNIPFDTKEHDFYRCFSIYGKLSHATLMFDKKTGKPKGSGFVKFYSKKEGEKCISNDQTDKGSLLINKNREIIIDGRTLLVTPVIDLNKKDKKNMALLNIGSIIKGSVAESRLSSFDIDKRLKIEQQRKIKIKSPLMYVSKTRLSIHNLAYSVNEKELKEVFKKNSGGKKIKQVKILKDDKNKSKGRAYVEFEEHESALLALKKTNLKEVFGKKMKPIVFFAIENKEIIIKRKKQTN